MANSFSSEKIGLEFEALVAIYEQELRVDFLQDNSMRYQIDLKDVDGVLSINLSDHYPDIPPNIKVTTSKSSVCNLIELEELLKRLSGEMLGEVMVYRLIEEARNWTKEKDNSQELRKEMTPEPAITSVCKFFLDGKCRFGDKCINKHESLHVKKGCNQLQDCDRKSKCTDESTVGQKDKETASIKKSPMKTASDVISRLLWDDKVDVKDFCIGYLDRFVGIIERPFTDFSWDDIASVDYNVLSIPRHRIQYFKYCNKIVWDKRERLDNVFGSTGSGLTIYKIINSFKREENESHPTTNEEQDKSTTVYSAASETPNLNENAKDANQPNYFLAIKIHNEEILENVDLLQKEVVSREKAMADGITSLEQLHITLLMLTIECEDQLTLVKDRLKGIRHSLPSILPFSHQLTFKGVGCFKDRILYVELDNDPALKKWVQILTENIKKAGICLDGNREVFTPHLTVLRSSSKISAAVTRQVFSTMERLYEGTILGSQRIIEVGLFSRCDPKHINGCHPKLFQIENSYLSVLPTLKDKLLQQAAYKDEGLKKEVQDLLQSDPNKALSLFKRSFSKNKLQYERMVVILRGIPGCGKTYLVENSMEGQDYQGLMVCSPKQLFYRAGNVPMTQQDLNIAEAYCRNSFLEALTSDVSLIVVDDCHSQCWQYSLYRDIAGVFGVPVKVLDISCNTRDNILQCSKHTDIPLEVLLKLAEEWEDDPDAISIKPWFKQVNQCMSLIGLVT